MYVWYITDIHVSSYRTCKLVYSFRRSCFSYDYHQLLHEAGSRSVSLLRISSITVDLCYVHIFMDSYWIILILSCTTCLLSHVIIENSNSAFCFSSLKHLRTSQERTYFGGATLRNRLHVFGGQNLDYKVLRGCRNICCNPVASMEGDLMKIGNILYGNFSSCKKTLLFAECEPSSKCKRLTAGGSLWRGDLRLSSGYVGGGPESRLSSCQCCQHMDVTAESVFCGYSTSWFPQKSIEATSFPAKVGSAMRFARRNCASCELEGRIYAIGGEQKFTTNWYEPYEVQDLHVYNMFIICFFFSMKYVLYSMWWKSAVLCKSSECQGTDFLKSWRLWWHTYHRFSRGAMFGIERLFHTQPGKKHLQIPTVDMSLSLSRPMTAV